TGLAGGGAVLSMKPAQHPRALVSDAMAELASSPLLREAPVASSTAPSAVSPSDPAPRRARVDAAQAEDETSLLRRAHAALRSGRAAEALALAADHARVYPSGALTQEREVIVIEALLRQGNRAEAEARAARFARAFPRSSHRRRIASLLGVEP